MELGSYHIVRKLATGGMAEIFLAQHKAVEGFQRNLVVKRILPEFSDNPEFVASFLNEAKLAAVLHHPNIVQIYDLGRVGKSYFIAMEYIRGFDLAAVLRLNRRQGTYLSLGVALQIFADVCAGLHHAHEATDPEGAPLGVVHRDVTPSNVLVAMEGQAKLVDFGIAKATSVGDGKTKTGTVKGKFAYLAPEQVLGAPIDRRVDVFACGIMLYEVLTNRNPFRGETEYQSLQNIVNLVVPSITDTRGDVPVAIDAILSKALQRTPADRFGTCRDLLAAVEEEASAHGITLSHSAVEHYLAEQEAQLKAQEERTQEDTSEMSGQVLELGSAGSLQRQNGTQFFTRVHKKWVTSLTLVAGASLAALLFVVGYSKTGSALREPMVELAPPSGLRIESEPPGAEVLIGNTLYTGLTPLTITLDSGTSYDVEVRRAGFKPAHTKVLLDHPAILPVQLTLGEAAKAPTQVAALHLKTDSHHALMVAPAADSQGPGRLRIVVQPWGTVEIDGTRVGDTPFAPRELASGPHTVTIENTELKKKVTKRVVINSGQEALVHENFLSD